PYRHLHSFPTRRSSDLMGDSHAVVERQVARHLPVVLDVPLMAVVNEVALEQLVDLRVCGEDPQRRIGEAKAGIERIVAVVAEVEDRKSTRLNSSHVSIS